MSKGMEIWDGSLTVTQGDGDSDKWWEVGILIDGGRWGF